MNHLKIAGGIGVVGLLILVITLVVKPILIDNNQTATSDASKVEHTITLAIDDWIGYHILCSDYNTLRLRSQGIGLKCVNDNANYEERMDKLRSGEYDMAVAEVGSYVLEGSRSQYPGVIISVIDVSDGGDAIVANKKVYPTIAELKKDDDAKFSLVANSPSEFFGLTTGLHFGIDYLRDGNWKHAQNTPDDAYRELMSGSANVAVLWEPYVTKALKTGDYVKLVSTFEAKNIITDVLMTNRRYAQDNKGIITKFLATYYKSLKYYTQNTNKLDEEIVDANPSLSEKDVESMRNGVRWINLTENCTVWFGCDENDWQAEVNVVDTIEMAVRTWKTYGEFSQNPLPDDDPYRLISSMFLQHLFEKGVDVVSGTTPKGNSLEKDFAKLTDAQWDDLKPFGQMRTEPVLFKSGTNTFRFQGRQVLDDIVGNMKHYPNFRIKIEGHTSSRGDDELNLTLSQKRADAVKRYLTRTYGIDEDRIKSVGFGGNKPLPVPPGLTEYSRAYQSKLARVEIHLLAEQY